MDDYGGGMSVMWIAIFEVMFIMWFYGATNFAKVRRGRCIFILQTCFQDINFMLNIKLDGCWSKFWHWILIMLWCLIPILLIVIQGVSLSEWSQPDYGNLPEEWLNIK